MSETNLSILRHFSLQFVTWPKNLCVQNFDKINIGLSVLLLSQSHTHRQMNIFLLSLSMRILIANLINIVGLNRVPTARRCQCLDGGLPQTSVRDAVLHVCSTQHSACGPLFGATDHSTAPPLLS